MLLFRCWSTLTKSRSNPWVQARKWGDPASCSTTSECDTDSDAGTPLTQHIYYGSLPARMRISGKVITDYCMFVQAARTSMRACRNPHYDIIPVDRLFIPVGMHTDKSQRVRQLRGIHPTQHPTSARTNSCLFLCYSEAKRLFFASNSLIAIKVPACWSNQKCLNPRC